MPKGGFGQAWTSEEDEQIRRHEGRLGASELARMLHRSEDGIRKRARKLGVSLKSGSFFWMPEEDAVLREHALKTSWANIADMLGRSAQGCKHRARALGLIHKPARENHPRKAKDGLRRCHDCGRPTSDYRCAKCWAKLREKYRYE